MYFPDIKVKKIESILNAQFVSRYVNPELGRYNKSLPFADRTYNLYPQLKGKIQDGMTYEEIFNIVEPIVSEKLNQAEKFIEVKINIIQDEFNKLGEKLLQNLLDLFQLEWPKNHPEINCYVGYIPVFPRNVITKEFWVSYEADINKIFTGAIHEINHFILFEKWKSMHGYTKEREPLHPEPLWFLEELVVDPTLNEPAIQAVAPYPQKAYAQFYSQTIDHLTIMDHIKTIYGNRSCMDDFLDNSYKFIVNNIEEIIRKCG